MKKMKKILPAIISGVLIIFNFNAFAAVINQPEVNLIKGDIKKSNIVITGTIPVTDPENEFGRDVTLTILDSRGKRIQVEQTVCDQAGNYSFNFNFQADSDTYTARIGFYGVTTSTEREKTFVYLSPEEYEILLKDVNDAIKAKNSTQLKAIIENCISGGVLVIESYEKLQNDGFNTENLFSMIINSGECESTAKIIEKMDGFAALIRINAETNSDRLTDLISDNKSILNLDGIIVNNYINTLSSKLSTINSVLMGINFENLTAFKETFYQTFVIESLKNELWMSIFKIIDDNNRIINIDFAYYNASPYKDEIIQAVTNDLSKYRTLAELKTGFENYSKNPPVKGSGSFSGGGTTGGGSGSGGSFITTSQIEYTPEIKEISLFKDIEGVEWAKEAIEKLAEYNIVSGKAEKLFYPNDNITREEFVKILVLGSGLLSESASSSFLDVSPNMWYYNYISSGVDLGIISGISETEFGIGQNISRQDMAVLCYRVMRLKGVKLPNPEENAFSDIDSGMYSYNAINAMKNMGIINGIGDGVFSPLSFATRAEAAKIIYEVLKNV